MKYHEICIEVQEEDKEELAGWLLDQELGYEERDGETLLRPQEGKSQLCVFLEPDWTPVFLDELKEAMAGKTYSYVTSLRDEKQWQEEWKNYFRIEKIGRVAIVPSWELSNYVPDSKEVLVQLDPGRAFGTGRHATTKLCLRMLGELLEKDVFPSHGVLLDVGCGSGILSIAALLLMPSYRAIGIDIDEEALEVSEENAILNGVQNRFYADRLPLKGHKDVYPLVFANLTALTLAELKDSLSQVIAPDGYLIVSGVLQTEAANIQSIYEEKGLLLQATLYEEEWACLCFLRK